MDVSSVAKSIWQAGVDSVKSDRLLKTVVHCSQNQLTIADSSFNLSDLKHIQVLGCGKAGRGMAAAVVKALADLPECISVSGHINVPADCAEPLTTDFKEHLTTPDRCQEIASNITVFAARPAGINEPTDAAIQGTQEILKRLQAPPERSLTIFLVSGGGSALLEAPRPGISLQDLLTVTRHLARSGATIQELNTVRAELSDVKAGGILRHAGHGRIISLIVSDIIGDPLPLIASGPTVPPETSKLDSLTVLKKYSLDSSQIPVHVLELLATKRPEQEITANFSNHLIATNSIACNAASAKARELGLEVISLGSKNCGEAADFGRSLARKLKQLKERPCPDSHKGFCVIAGGETTVTLSDSSAPGKGGRNQEAALAALNILPASADWKQMAVLFGGTDGEDGPTDAAGAFVNEHIAHSALRQNQNLTSDLDNHNAYPFFEACGGLLKTGPTHTNVMDLAVGIVHLR